MGKFNEALVKAGVMLAAEGLHPSSRGVRVRFGQGKGTVIDGPFTQTRELIAGFWLWKVKSVGEAVEWIRRVFEAEDFGQNMTPELKAQEESLRARSAMKNWSTGTPALKDPA